MQLSRWVRISLLLALPLVMFGAVGCDDDNDVTGSGGALASLNLDVPESVNSGAPFDISWQLNTLDSNTSSDVVVHTTGTLPAGSPSASLTIQASLVAEGIPSGDLVASENITLMP